MNKSAILTLLFVTTIQLLSAQKTDTIQYFNISDSHKYIAVDSIKAIYEREAIFFDGKGSYLKNGKALSMGFFNRKLRKEIAKSQEGAIELKIYRKIFNTNSALMVGGYFGGMVVLIASGNPLGLLLFVLAIIGAIDFPRAYKHFHKSIWCYNRDVLIDGAKKSAR